MALECKDDSSTLKFYMFFLPDTRWNFQIFGFSTVVAKNLWLLSWEPSLCATVRKQQYGCGERSELHSTSHSYSQQKYTIGLPYWKMIETWFLALKTYFSIISQLCYSPVRTLGSLLRVGFYYKSVYKQGHQSRVGGRPPSFPKISPIFPEISSPKHEKSGHS